MTNYKLAIVIPFYKINHFEELLDALSKQTNKEFNLYIGDDFSDNSPVSILEKYNKKLSVIYKRFDDRLGDKSLTAQWARCLQMTGDEDWIWFLPDDDVPSINCVSEFYKFLQHYNCKEVNVIRMPLQIVDGNGVVLEPANEIAPECEDNYSFYNRVVNGKARSSLGDNIFRKEAFLKTGGFVEFFKGWGSDHATVVRVSTGSKIYFMKNAMLSFRMSGDNISSNIYDGLDKIRARINFAKWLKGHDDLFDKKPEPQFYYSFYTKVGYYFVYMWPLKLALYRELYLLSVICYDSYSPIPVLKILIRKIYNLVIQRK